MKDIRQQKREKGTFRRKELLGQFMAKKLFGQLDKQYDEEYWGRLEGIGDNGKRNKQEEEELQK